jgi:hypothetical protein
MARLVRLVIPGLPRHITQRGNRRQQTLFNEDDYEAYLNVTPKARPRPFGQSMERQQKKAMATLLATVTKKVKSARSRNYTSP